MKPLVITLLALILAVLLYGVSEYRENAERVLHERDMQTLAECWDVARANGGAGVDLCQTLADSVNR